MTTLTKTIGTLLPAMRISFSLVLLTACLLLTAEMLGFTPVEAEYLLESRRHVSEALAVEVSVFDIDEDYKKLQTVLSYVVKHNPDLVSAGIRLANGQLIFEVNDHARQWLDYQKDQPTSTHLALPVKKGNQPWGEIEFKFIPLPGESGFSFLEQPIIKLSIFVLVVGFFVYLVFMLRTLRMLDPTAIIPDRVNAAFDTLSEGVMILDEKEHIVLANKAFTEKVAMPSLIGKKISLLKWQNNNGNLSEQEFPWRKVLQSGKSTIGAPLILTSPEGNQFKFVINASPIDGGNNVTQGVLITLDDITELEERNVILQTMVARLEESQEQVQQQNKELHFLATRDSLTGCLNRRSFSEMFEKAFQDAKKINTELSCIMVDLDHFKSVNDNYGHATGDVVIKLLAEILLANTRKVDLVGRYGGEEFCLVLPDLSIEEAFTVAERIRLRIKDETAHRFPEGPRVTASLGVASIKDNPVNPDELNNFADQALYVAKESGRNQVIRWQEKVELYTEAQATTPTKLENITVITPQTTEAAHVIKLEQRVNELEFIAAQFSAELEYNKNYDALTGLPNQSIFFDRTHQIVERGHRHNQLAAVLVVDVGNLSQVNTTLGRFAGDNLLVEISKRLNASFRKSDGITRLTVSRFSGNEFAVLLNDLQNKEMITWMVKRLQDTLAEPVDIDGNSVYLTSHVGISIYPSDANSVDALVNNALTAKKFSKQLHSETNYQFFDKYMQELSVKHLRLDKELRQAIENQEWQLLYQPKMDIKTKAIIGAEALIRWQHPTRGLLLPFEFIEFAEQRGLIVAIGEWVIQTACKQLEEWTAQGFSDCKIAINLSAVQLRQEAFVDKTFQTLADRKIPPRQLEFEVTETTLMNNFQLAQTALKRLNSRGINIAIDDFGTGYSSLSYLKNLPVNTLKIDRTFIKDICTDDNDRQIVKALINMAHSMRLLVVAEGVEDKEQFNLLEEYNCDEIQGYLLSRPVTAKQLAKLLENPSQLLS